MPKAPHTVQKFFDVPNHGSMVECASIIQQLQAAGVRISKQIAVLICEAKYAYFPKDYKGWIAWVDRELGLQARYAVYCLNAGDLLKAHLAKFPALAEVGIAELEAIHSIGNERLIKDWLSNHDPREMSRSEIRESVKQFRLADGGEGGAAPLPKATEEPPANDLPAIPGGDDETATEFMSRLQRLMAFDPRRLDPVKQADYAQAYCIRFQQSLEAHLENLNHDQLALMAEHVTNFRDGFAEIHSTLSERLS